MFTNCCFPCSCECSRSIWNIILFVRYFVKKETSVHGAWVSFEASTVLKVSNGQWSFWHCEGASFNVNEDQFIPALPCKMSSLSPWCNKSFCCSGFKCSLEGSKYWLNPTWTMLKIETEVSPRRVFPLISDTIKSTKSLNLVQGLTWSPIARAPCFEHFDKNVVRTEHQICWTHPVSDQIHHKVPWESRLVLSTNKPQDIVGFAGLLLVDLNCYRIFGIQKLDIRLQIRSRQAPLRDGSLCI